MVTEMCISAANYIIEKVNEYNMKQPTLRTKVWMTSKRLQKILFFSDVLYMFENSGRTMFNDDFYAWPSGPVIPSVYDEFVQYQEGEMKPNFDGTHTPLDNTMINVLDRVISDTMTLDTSELISKSHENGGPWQSIYDENEYKLISKEAIYDYYTRNPVPYGTSN